MLPQTRSLAGFKGSYISKGRKGSGREKGRGRGIMGKGERGRGLEPPPLQISGYATGLCHGNSVCCPFVRSLAYIPPLS